MATPEDLEMQVKKLQEQVDWFMVNAAFRDLSPATYLPWVDSCPKCGLPLKAVFDRKGRGLSIRRLNRDKKPGLECDRCGYYDWTADWLYG